MRQAPPLHTRRGGAGSREGGGGLLYALALLREVGHLRWMGPGAPGVSEEVIRGDRAALIVAGRLLTGRHGRGRPVRRVLLRGMPLRGMVLPCGQRRVGAALAGRRWVGARGGSGFCAEPVPLRDGIPRPSYGAADRLAYNLSHLLLVGEAHQLLGRVHVDVHLPRVDLDAQRHRRKAARGHGRAVGIIYPLGQGFGPYPPAVHRERLARAAGLGDARQRRVARDLVGARLVVHPPHRFRRAHAVELGEALEEVLGRGKGEHLFALLREAERHPGVGYGEVGHSLHYGRPLRAGALQEGPPRRHVVEEPVDQHGGALGVRGGGDLYVAAAVGRDTRARTFAGRGGQGEGGDAGHGGQRLAAEA